MVFVYPLECRPVAALNGLTAKITYRCIPGKSVLDRREGIGPHNRYRIAIVMPSATAFFIIFVAAAGEQQHAAQNGPGCDST